VSRRRSGFGGRQTALPAGSGVDFACRVEVHQENPQTDHEVGPGRHGRGGDGSGRDDRDIGQDVVTGREKCRARQAAALGAAAHEEAGAAQVHDQSPAPSKGQGHGVQRHGP